MNNRLVVIDDDVDLVTELRQYLAKNHQDLEVVGPPELPLDLRGIRENIAGASAIVLDLNIGGSATYGMALLQKLRRKLNSSDTPVIVWSKYLGETIVFEPAGIFRLLGANPASPVEAIDDKNLESLEDFDLRIKPLREIYNGAVAFVSKASSDPPKLLCAVLKRLGVIARAASVAETK